MVAAASNPFQNINGNVWTSADSGVTWTERLGTTASWYSLATSDDGMKLVGCAYRGSLWTSTDGGANWAERTNGGTLGGSQYKWKDVASSADGTRLIAAAWQGNLWTSTDSGVSWAQCTQPNSGPNGWVSVASSADGLKLYAVSDNTPGLFMSTDAGASWTKDNVTFATVNEAWNYVACSADGTKVIGSVWRGNLWRSEDSGATWVEDTSIARRNQQWNAVGSSADGSKLAASIAQGFVWTSADFGASWVEHQGNYNSIFPVKFSGDGSKLLGARYGSNLWIGSE